MERKLVSMVEYIMQHPATEDYEWQLGRHYDYANFLRQPLTLGMFVPVGENGEVLEEPKEYKGDYDSELLEWEYAWDKVIFEGWQVIGHEEGFTEIELTDRNLWISFYKGRSEITNYSTFLDILESIEDLVPYGLTLTENALR